MQYSPTLYTLWVMLDGDEERKKKERKKMNKLKFSCLSFVNLIKVSETYTVDLALEWRSNVFYKCFAHYCLFFVNCSYTLCTGGYFESAPYLTKKYYCTSYVMYNTTESYTTENKTQEQWDENVTQCKCNEMLIIRQWNGNTVTR